MRSPLARYAANRAVSPIAYLTGTRPIADSIVRCLPRIKRGAVRIYLQEGELTGGYTIQRLLGSAYASAGSWTWNIPANEAPRADARIRIQSVDNSTLADSSDSVFDIVP